LSRANVFWFFCLYFLFCFSLLIFFFNQPTKQIISPLNSKTIQNYTILITKHNLWKHVVFKSVGIKHKLMYWYNRKGTGTMTQYRLNSQSLLIGGIGDYWTSQIWSKSYVLLTYFIHIVNHILNSVLLLIFCTNFY